MKKYLAIAMCLLLSFTVVGCDWKGCGAGTNGLSPPPVPPPDEAHWHDPPP